ncbi:hypothetical protein KZZ52_28700 [Dactylosporangium sp. AC04546]|nr:hypothetical protein [Dactylosporangium sp. AC04546]WVK89250.1 hypothetical protein KZZ52_28700 [Dactylosporangium sp. AC04546]
MRDELVSPAARNWLWSLLVAQWAILAWWTVAAVREVRRGGRVRIAV